MKNYNMFSRKQEEKEWKEREVKRFNERIGRRRWIRALEKINDIEKFHSGMPFKVPIPAKYLYWDARNSFIYGLYYSSINTMASCIESTIAGRIDPNLFAHIPPKRLTLFKLIELSFDNKYFDFDLAYQLHEFRVYRNNVIHSKMMVDDKLYLSEITHYSGKTRTSRSGGWEADSFLHKMLSNAPTNSGIDRKKLKGVIGVHPKKVAKMGLELFFQVRYALL